MTKIYHYIFYRTYQVISKTNKLNPKSSSAGLISITILINFLTLYSLIFQTFNPIGFYVFMSIGIILSFLNLVYFNENRIKLIISEFETLKISKYVNYLIDINYWFFLIVFLIALGSDYYTILVFVGILILLRLMQYFYEM